MKKLLLLSLFLFLAVCSASAMIVTDNVDKDRFLYQTPYTFATTDLAISLTRSDMPLTTGSTNENINRVVTRSGSIVGMSAIASRTLTAGGATFDITINGNLTGIRTVFEPGTARASVGAEGLTGTTYSYIRLDRADRAAPQGFLPPGAYDMLIYGGADAPWGIATPLTVGDKIGVKVTTTSSLLPAATNDVFVTVYVLE